MAELGYTPLYPDEPEETALMRAGLPSFYFCCHPRVFLCNTSLAIHGNLLTMTAIVFKMSKMISFIYSIIDFCGVVSN